jgi:LysR family transcriptional regulator, transcription activator of glutamate synthase operon
MEMNQIKYFLTVAELGSFSAAADSLYISQSSLSKQIMALEKELGVELFDRSKRSIILTEAGETFRKHAHRLNDEYKALISSLKEYKSAASLTIVAIPVIAQYGITSFIAQFQSAYPNLQLMLEEREASTILPALNNHQFDLAFIRDNYLDSEQYHTLEINTDKFVVALSLKHPLASRTSISLSELANENFIMFDKGTIVHELAVDACHKAGFEPRNFYASLRVESILGLVASQSGVALIMEKVFQYHKHPDVIAIPLAEIIESKIVLAYLKNKKLSVAAKNFWEFIRDYPR